MAVLHHATPELLSSSFYELKRSAATGVPYVDEAWVARLAKQLDLDLTIRPRGRPRNK